MQVRPKQLQTALGAVPGQFFPLPTTYGGAQPGPVPKAVWVLGLLLPQAPCNLGIYSGEGVRATSGLSAWALSFFRLIDCLRGSSPSYYLRERRWQGRASSLAISAGMGKNISLTGLSLLPGDSSSCSSCQLKRKLQAMWPLCIFPLR